MNLAAVKARGLAHQLLGSCSGREAHHCRRGLLLAAAWLLAACTLTDDAFEPGPVDRAGGELNPEASNEALPSPDEEAPAMPPSDGSEGDESSDGNGSGSSEGNGNTDGSGSSDGSGSEGEPPDPGNVPLDPAGSGNGTSGTPGAGTSTGSSSGEAGTGQGDAGLGPEVDGEIPDVDTEPEPPTPPPCPGMAFGDSCYEVFAERVAWSVAEQRCSDRGAHLASVESLEEDTFLDAWPAQLGVFVADGSGIWLGGTDALVESDFRWSDDSPLTFRGWAPNQPDNGAGVDCIEKRNDGTTLWYDRRCVDALPYVCERPR